MDGLAAAPGLGADVDLWFWCHGISTVETVSGFGVLRRAGTWPAQGYVEFDVDEAGNFGKTGGNPSLRRRRPVAQPTPSASGSGSVGAGSGSSRTTGPATAGADQVCA